MKIATADATADATTCATAGATVGATVSELLQAVEDNFNAAYARIMQTQPLVVQTDCNGTPVYVTHSVKNGREWSTKRTPAMMVNPKIVQLRNDAYIEKSAILKAYACA